MRRKFQPALIKKNKTEYGGEYLKKRSGRSHGRPLSTKSTMHIVLRSTKATGAKSFKRFRKDIAAILEKFGSKYAVQIVSLGNAGNHLHLQIKLSNRYTYCKFIRAVTSAIAMKVGGVTRWTKQVDHSPNDNAKSSERFWDRRPFSRVVESFREFLNLKDYIRINELEGYGYCRKGARFEVAMEKLR